jgi:hypothetical protein
MPRRVADPWADQPGRLSPPDNPCADFDETMSADPKQVLILGGGFAGVYTARYLEKLLRPQEASITLINRRIIGSTSRCFRKSFPGRSA